MPSSPEPNQPANSTDQQEGPSGLQPQRSGCTRQPPPVREGDIYGQCYALHIYARRDCPHIHGTLLKPCILYTIHGVHCTHMPWDIVNLHISMVYGT